MTKAERQAIIKAVNYLAEGRIYRAREALEAVVEYYPPKHVNADEIYHRSLRYDPDVA